MAEKNYTGLVPENKEGRSITVNSIVQCDSETAAKALYHEAKQRLLYVHNWGKIAGALSSDFRLTDASGNEADRLAQKGDYFRIDIPGPGSKAGEGYDWAGVEEIKEVNNVYVDSIAMRVRPGPNPQTANQNVAHFYSNQSTSTFVVTREGTMVTASIYDRNIEANDETEEPLDKVRNAVVGIGGKYGFSRLQWEALAGALLAKSQV